MSKDNDEIKIKFWIARDEGISQDGSDRYDVGKLHIFYDTPEYIYDYETRSYKFGNSREMCEVPSYMFPEIEEGDCVIMESTSFRFKEGRRQ